MTAGRGWLVAGVGTFAVALLMLAFSVGSALERQKSRPSPLALETPAITPSAVAEQAAPSGATTIQTVTINTPGATPTRTNGIPTARATVVPNAEVTASSVTEPATSGTQTFATPTSTPTAPPATATPTASPIYSRWDVERLATQCFGASWQQPQASWLGDGRWLVEDIPGGLGQIRAYFVEATAQWVIVKGPQTCRS